MKSETYLLKGVRPYAHGIEALPYVREITIYEKVPGRVLVRNESGRMKLSPGREDEAQWFAVSGYYNLKDERPHIRKQEEQALINLLHDYDGEAYRIGGPKRPQAIWCAVWEEGKVMIYRFANECVMDHDARTIAEREAGVDWVRRNARKGNRKTA